MIPSNLKYSNKIESSASRSYRSNLAPQNGTGPYYNNQTIIFNLPCIGNTVTPMSENYLKFNLNVKNGTTANNYVRFDSQGSHSIIQSIRVTSGSNQLEYINNYNMLAKEIFDLYVSSDSSYNKYNILAACRNDTITTNQTWLAADFQDASGNLVSTGAALATALNTRKINQNKQINTGIKINPTAQLAIGDTSSTISCCLNLISLIGTLGGNQYFPLFACGSGLRVEITLTSTANLAFCTAQTLDSYYLSDVEYVMNIIEISDTAMNMISNSLDGKPLQYVIPQYSNFVYSQSLTDSCLVNVPIPAKYASIKSIYTSIRDTACIGTNTYFPFSSHAFNLQSYVFKIGFRTLPQKAPSNYIEMFAETLKAVASMSDQNHTPAIELDSYSGGLYSYESVPTASKCAPVANTETAGGPCAINSGSFIISLDLENWINSDRSQIWAGYNSNNEDLFLQMQYGNIATSNPAGARPTVRYDTFVLYDALLTFQNGVCYVST